jgi:hypothetical protein
MPTEIGVVAGAHEISGVAWLTARVTLAVAMA